MFKYLLVDIHEGMIVGKSVFDSNKRLIIAEGFRLNKEHIELLKTKGIESLYITTQEPVKELPKTVITERVKSELSETIKKFSTDVGNIVGKSKENMEDVVKIIKQDKSYINKIIRNSNAERIVVKVIDDILREPWAIINLEKIRETGTDFHTYVLNVLVISLCVGHKFHFSHNELKQLGLGAINYDIGMLAIPEKIMEKDSELTADEKGILMQHAVYGYIMLSNITSIPAASTIVAFSHHEHQDGSGFPKGLKGGNRPPLKTMQKKGLIHRFAEIVSVVDTYDMLTNGRKHFSLPMEPPVALQKMIEMRRTKLNFEILKTFISILPIYPVGTRIRVTNSPRSELMGCYGVIADVRPERIFEPKVVLVESKLQKRLPKTMMLDFAKHRGFEIELA